MSRRPALMNRIALTVIGLLLVAIGGTALVRGLNFFPHVFGVPHTTVVDQSARAFTGRHTWFWIALAAALFALAVACVYWLIVLARRGTARVVRLERGTRGVTTVSAHALTDAVREDLEASPHLRHCRGRLLGDPAAPRLHLTVTAEPDAEPSAAQADIHQALHRLHQAVEPERLPVTVRLRIGR
jgi:hypothetical protein